MNYLFTICGRAGSKGLPNKNTSNFLGIPLVYYSIAAIELVSDFLKKENHVCKVALNTDSKQLVDLIQSQKGVEVLYVKRLENLAGDRVAKVSVILDTLIKAEEHYNTSFDYVIDLDITSPLRTVSEVLLAIKKKEINKESDVVYSLTDARKNPYFTQSRLVNGLYEKVIHADYVSRQDTPQIYDMNGSIYVYEPKALHNKEHNVFFNDKADAIIMKDTAVLDIDCEEEKDMMEVLAEHYFYKKYKDYRDIYCKAKKIEQNRDKE